MKYKMQHQGSAVGHYHFTVPAYADDATILMSDHPLEDTVCLEMIRHKVGSIVSIIKTSEVKVKVKVHTLDIAPLRSDSPK